MYSLYVPISIAVASFPPAVCCFCFPSASFPPARCAVSSVTSILYRRSSSLFLSRTVHSLSYSACCSTDETAMAGSEASSECAAER